MILRFNYIEEMSGELDELLSGLPDKRKREIIAYVAGKIIEAHVHGLHVRRRRSQKRSGAKKAA